MRCLLLISFLITTIVVPPGASHRSGNQLGSSGAQAIAELKRELTIPNPPEAHTEARESLAKRQAAAALKLLQLGQENIVWPLLRHSSDPTRRTYLIHSLAQANIDPETIARELEKQDVTVRRALILSLGQFGEEQVPRETRQVLLKKLLQLYRDDPDPGVHSAIDWLLRHRTRGNTLRRLNWQQTETLRMLDRELVGRAGNRRWYATKEGYTFAIVRRPPAFLMGSPEFERSRNADERQHNVLIPRSFAVATKEVSVKQFQRFLDANPEIKKRAQAAGSKDPTRDGPVLRRFSPEDECPQILMTWYEAAMYCNWLSKEEGIPESEWCYPADVNAIKDGMVLANNYLQRIGYRLPTQAEWEFACRAGAATSRFFGSSEEMLKEYAWYSKNPPTSRNDPIDPTDPNRTWPVGQSKPNDLGLFDVLGNVWEWGQDQWLEYPSESLSVDNEGRLLTVKDVGTPRPRRGGSFSYGANFMRCAHRGTTGGYSPNERRDSVGFRVARTVR